MDKDRAFRVDIASCDSGHADHLLMATDYRLPSCANCEINNADNHGAAQHSDRKNQAAGNLVTGYIGIHQDDRSGYQRDHSANSESAKARCKHFRDQKNNAEYDQAKPRIIDRQNLESV